MYLHFDFGKYICNYKNVPKINDSLPFKVRPNIDLTCWLKSWKRAFIKIVSKPGGVRTKIFNNVMIFITFCKKMCQCQVFHSLYYIIIAQTRKKSFFCKFYLNIWPTEKFLFWYVYSSLKIVFFHFLKKICRGKKSVWKGK